MEGGQSNGIEHEVRESGKAVRGSGAPQQSKIESVGVLKSRFSVPDRFNSGPFRMKNG